MGARLNSTIRKKYQEKYQLRKMGGDWSTGLFGCFADPGSFCMAICGWPFLVGKNAEAIGEDGTLWALSAWSCCTNSLLRTNIRKKQGIEGRFAIDFLLHCFCGCCAIAQEARHLKSIEKYMDGPDMQKVKDVSEDAARSTKKN